jgi:flagellin-like protein
MNKSILPVLALVVLIAIIISGCASVFSPGPPAATQTPQLPPLVCYNFITVVPQGMDIAASTAWKYSSQMSLSAPSTTLPKLMELLPKDTKMSVVNTIGWYDFAFSDGSKITAQCKEE